MKETRITDRLKEMRELPVYQHSAEYAQKHGELEAYHASHEANVACKEVIEVLIAEHYHDNRLCEGGVARMVEQFGFDRPIYVLANTVQEKSYDGRISQSSKDWAETVPVAEDKGECGENRKCYFVVDRCSPGLVDLFIKQVRREYRVNYPIIEKDLIEEAERILHLIKNLSEPNCPEHTHFIAQFSMGFLARGDSRDMDKLMQMLPFSEMAFTGLPDRAGHFAMVPRNAERNKPLRFHKRSGEGKFQKELLEGTNEKREKKIRARDHH